MARVTADSPLVPVWLLLYKGGTIDIPMGPVGDVDGAKPLTPAYTGVMLDDNTGEVLLVFAGGSQ